MRKWEEGQLFLSCLLSYSGLIPKYHWTLTTNHWMETSFNWMFTFQFYQQSTSIVIFSFTNSVIILGYKESLWEAERGLDYPELQFLGASIIMKVATPQHSAPTKCYNLLQKRAKRMFFYIFSVLLLPLTMCQAHCQYCLALPTKVLISLENHSIQT